MQKPEKNLEEFFEKALKKSQPTAATDNEGRIARTMAKAQQSTNTRDVILLVFVRFWMVFTEITCKFIAKSSKH